MKKAYIAPSLEVEQYQLDANIAQNCAYVVNMGGPGGDLSKGEEFCKDYADLVGLPFPDNKMASTFAYNVNFWEHTCDCYTTAGGVGVFTS